MLKRAAEYETRLRAVLFVTIWHCAACSAGGPRGEDLLGKWQEIGKTEVLEFFTDGRVAINDRRRSSGGGWTILEDGRIKIEGSMLGSTVIFTGTMIRDTLVFVLDGDTSKYLRQSSDKPSETVSVPKPAPDQSTDPKFTSLRSDLLNIISSQKAYLKSRGTYAPDFPALVNAYPGLRLSYGATANLAASETGYSAVVNRDASAMCKVDVGGGVPSDIDGVIRCR